jgi:aspartate/methionine/tyrosine aminotransferase
MDTMTPPQDTPAALARDAIRALPASRIREVANAAMGRPDVLPFWFGEPDAVTAEPVRAAACAALAAGDTFYLPNLGMPRAAGIDRAVPVPSSPTGSGRAGGGDQFGRECAHARGAGADRAGRPGGRGRAAVAQPHRDPGDPGAQAHRVGLTLSAGRWTLDLDRLLQAIDADTRAVILNSPSNPTGWTLPAPQMRALLEHCRARVVWVLSDEAYERLVFDGTGQAPSMLDHAHEDDRVIVANTFSKTWLMTGWRLGWLTAPRALVD